MQARERRHTDGTRILYAVTDTTAEEATRQQLETAWRCTLHPFGPLCAIDWYATRHGRLAAVLELKIRSHTRVTYPTLYLSVRKWLALTLASNGLGCPAFFVARFLDGIGYVRIGDVDASRHVIGGRERQRTAYDTEPLIEVPVSQLSWLAP